MVAVVPFVGDWAEKQTVLGSSANVDKTWEGVLVIGGGHIYHQGTLE